MHINFIQNLIDNLRGKDESERAYLPVKDIDVENKIVCVGDSHVSFFSGNEKIVFRPFKNDINNCRDKLKEFVTFHLGPALAYNLDKYNTTNRTREKIEFLINEGYIKSGCTLLLVFGEVDMRVHAIKQAEKQNIPLEDVLTAIAKNYLQGLSIFPKNTKIYLWAPVADGIFYDKPRSDVERMYPAYGSQKDINKATELFIKILKREAVKYNVEVLSIFDKLIDENYVTKLEYYADDIHIGLKAWEIAEEELLKIDLYKQLKSKEVD